MWLMLGIPKLHIFVNTHLMKIQSIENTLATVGKQMGGGRKYCNSKELQTVNTK